MTELPHATLGHAPTAPVDRTCPAGTQETHELECVYEKRGGPPPPWGAGSTRRRPFSVDNVRLEADPSCL